MGRRGNMRNRPGLLFIIIFVACLAILYFSWRSMSSSSKVKDAFTAQKKPLFHERGSWKNAVESQEIGNHDRDPDYDIDDARNNPDAPVVRQYEPPDNKDENKILVLPKPQLKDVNISDTDSAEKEQIGTEFKDFYRQPNGFIAKAMTVMERFVHLDLKGAAPKMIYLRKFIPLVRKLGATGLLIEYEDMFPFTGFLKIISASNAYSMDDIKELLELARMNELKVMPLIQTFGHMEFVLKSEFSNLRESAYTPQVIDITQNATYHLISEMINQMLNAHPDASHLHIGCDEVYELGKGATGLVMQNKLTKSQLFLHHVQTVASIVKKHNGKGVIPVIWDDELRKTQTSEIESSRLPSLVEIMVWRYTDNVPETIPAEVWDKYSKLFKSVWIASAFKGATGSRQFFTEPKYHIKNHFSWLDVIAANNRQINFKGVALTGWQRYDHFATLCELLPVSVPSLAVCLATLVNAGFNKEIHIATSKLLNCSQPIEMTFPEIDKQTHFAIVTQDCRFPGHEVYHAVQELYGYTTGLSVAQERLDGWLSDYQVNHGYSNPGQLKVLSKTLSKIYSGLSMVSIPLQRNLADIYFDDTVEEWMDEQVRERQRFIKKQQDKIELLSISKTWPQRPLLRTSRVNRMSNENVNIQQGQSEIRKSNEINSQQNPDLQQQFNRNSANNYNFGSGSQNSFNINPKPNEKSIDSRISNGSYSFKESKKWNENKAEDSFDKKRSSDSFQYKKDLNFTVFNQNRMDKLSDSFKLDGNKEENRGVNPKRFKPANFVNPIQPLPNLVNLPANPQVDVDDKLQRQRYLGGVKVDINLDKDQANVNPPKQFDFNERKSDGGLIYDGGRVRRYSDKPKVVLDSQKDPNIGRYLRYRLKLEDITK